MHHPVLLAGLYVLDLLVIHPFDNGNGCTARLTTTALLRRHSLEVVRYVSIEGLVDRTSDDYYRTLKASTDAWHESGHDVWPWLTYLVERIVEGYEAFDAIIETQLSGPPTKAERVRVEISRHRAPFSKRDLVDALPGISSATVTKVLQQMRDEGVVKAVGTGPGTVWRIIDR